MDKLRKPDRIMKLTADSVLFLDGNRVKSETHYAGLERVWLDAVDASIFWLQYKVCYL